MSCLVASSVRGFLTRQVAYTQKAPVFSRRARSAASDKQLADLVA